jgi:hypothetical protein
MFRIFYAEKDATLYESSPEYNTGLDEILEIGKRLGTDGSTLQKSRSVVKFDMSEIRSTLSKYSVDLNDCKFLLQLYTTNAKNLPAEYTITANVLAQDWINGTGFQSSDPIIGNGITWNYPVSDSMWISSSQQIQVNSSSLYISGSGLGGSWLYQSGSGVFNQSFFNQSFFTQPGLGNSEDFSYRPTDLNIDVTDAVKLWISGSGGRSIDNNGFLLRFSDSDELNNLITGYIRFFSRETHTIYVPKLTMYWDNSTFTTGTLTAVDLESYSAYTSIKPQYKDTEVAKIRIFSRDKYPRKSPTNLAPYQTVKYLPETTYYTVLDAATDEVIIPYDNIYNKVSCDSTSNFIYVDMNGFMPERYYRLEFKIVDGFTEQYITDSVYFKVVR